MPPIIACDGLQHRYGSAPVLDIDRLVIPAGSTALLGPNGAGKTTLLQAVATVAPVQQGTITIDGADTRDPADRVRVRRRLGYVTQRDGLPAQMRVDEFCHYIACLKEIGPARRRRRWTSWVLAQVGLSDEARQKISTLSGGMRRRLTLAQALLGHPDLLVLDEPLVSLDAAHRSSLIRLIAESAPTRTTIIATHHADEMAAVCRHVIVMTTGRVRFAGSPDALAAKAEGQVWETTVATSHPTTRALGPERFRLVGERPEGAVAAEPTVHDGYLSLLTT